MVMYGMWWTMSRFVPHHQQNKTQNQELGRRARHSYVMQSRINKLCGVIGGFFGLPSRQCQYVFLTKIWNRILLLVNWRFIKFRVNMCFFNAGKHSQIRESSKQGIWPLEVRFPTFLFVWLPRVTFFGCGQHHKSQQDKGCNAPKV